jgi:hypothetical protein
MREKAPNAWIPKIAFLVLFAIIIFVSKPTSAGDDPVVLTPNAGPVPASLFCLNILFHPLTKVPWPAVPFAGWRLSHTNWADLEPQKDNWYFTLLDRYADWADQHHTEILMPLAYTPTWASSVPDAKTDVEANAPPGLSGPPQNMEDWKNFVRTIATRYKGRIHVFEIWNEPNRPQSWVGDVDTMITMTQQAREILKEIDPHNIVVAPAPEQERGAPWLEEFLRKGGARYVDVIAYHFYVGQKPPETMVPLIQKVRGLMAQYHTGERPLWNTEAGWLGPNHLPAGEAAGYLARAYILNWAGGVNRFYWYAWEAHNFTEVQLTEKDNTALTPAGVAYRTVEQWMIGSVLNRCVNSSDGFWVCDLSRNGSESHIVWNPGSDRTFTLPQNWNATRIIDLQAHESPFSGNSISVGAQPVLLQ